MIALPTTAVSGEPTNDTSTMTPQSPPAQQVQHVQQVQQVAGGHLPSPQLGYHRNSTPSISPLSTASRNHNEYFGSFTRPRQSPNLERKTDSSHATDGDVPAPDLVMRDDHDDRSSSLSDFDANLDDQENNQPHDALSPPPVEEVDSEAETERLERTPQKPWRNADTGRTPSKLNQETTIQDHLSDPLSSPKSPDRDAQSPSPSPSRPGVYPYSQHPDNLFQLTKKDAASPSALAGQKRKRSPPASEPDSPLSDAASDSEEIVPPVRLNGTANVQHAATKDVPEQSVEEVTTEEQRDDAPQPESARETPELDDAEENENPYISPMKAARLKGKKQRAKRQKEPAVAQRQNLEAEYDDAADADEMQEDDENPAKSEEELQNRKQAQASYATLVERFHIFRTKLHEEKLSAAEAELEQLLSDPPSHPDYIAQLQCITARRDTKIKQEYARQYYKLQALRTQTLAEHAQLHSQFFQEAREVRENKLEELGKTWYDIQKERRQTQPDHADQYTHKFSTRFGDQIRNQANYNREVSILSGIQRHVGFPAAPEIHSTRPTELDHDLRAMNIPRQHTVNLPVYQNQVETNGMPARAAQEKWLEQNPWANPQHPSNQQSRTPAPFPPYGFANPPANPSMTLFRQGSAHGHRTSSPFITPMAQRRADHHESAMGSAETIGIASDPPSSVPQAPQTAEKTQHRPSKEDGSPIDSLRVRAAIGNPFANRDDRRNFSNISSASTIDAPTDHTLAPDIDRHHNPYAGLAHQLRTESSNQQQAFVTNALHAQHGKPDDRRPDLFDSVNFRPQMGAYAAPMPLFAGGSPARQEGQKAT